MSDETLFLQYLDAVDRGERPDIDRLCEEADKPEELRKNIAFHESIGTNLGRFRLIRELGSGGFGSVFLAHDPDLNRQVAIKVMGGVDWARNEARSLARLRHPNIVEVFEIEEDFIVMEYVQGKPLSPVGAPHERLGVLLQLADAVAYAHGEGVLSRDIKPDNVLVTEDGQVKLIDFSIAHIDDDDTDLNITHSLVASPAYLAPEQIESGETGASPQSDQFSLGVLAYEYLTGKHPFRVEGGGRRQVIDAIARCAPVRPPGLSRDLQNILLKALELDPRLRYSNVAAFREDLFAALELRPVSVSKANPLRVLRRHKRWIVLGVIVLVAALAPQVAQYYSRRSEIRLMPLDTALQVERALSALMIFPDLPTALRIEERLETVAENDEWASAAWRFQQITGLEAPIDLGRVFAPPGAVFERKDRLGKFQVIEFSPDTPLGTGYYRCNGQEFRKISMWDNAVTIGEVELNTDGSSLINGIRATGPILDADGYALGLNLDEAMAFARKRGGRLPLISELIQMGVKEGPALREWVGDYLFLSSGTARGALDMDISYSYRLASEQEAIADLDVGLLVEGVFVRSNPSSAIVDGRGIPSTCFRIVFPSTKE